jgi:hypothetical protein
MLFGCHSSYENFPTLSLFANLVIEDPSILGPGNWNERFRIHLISQRKPRSHFRRPNK